jgi:hypothetical protein
VKITDIAAIAPLTHAERTWLEIYRRMDDSTRLDCTRGMSAIADAFPRVPAPRLHLVRRSAP